MSSAKNQVQKIKDISGVTEVRIDGSFPWATAIPGDTNKITVNLEIKDQNGNKVEQKDESVEKTDNDGDEGAEEKSEKSGDETKKE